jgi:hypothetical protein
MSAIGPVHRNPAYLSEEDYHVPEPRFRGFTPRAADARRAVDPTLIWLSSTGATRPGSIIVGDKTASVVHGALGGGLVDPHRKGTLTGLIEALGGPEEARKLGVREMRNPRNLFGLAPGEDFELPVEIDRRLAREDFESLGFAQILMFRLSPKVVEALRQRGISDASAGRSEGLEIVDTGRDVFIGIQKSLVRSAKGMT